jgi:hypothetical protein
MQGGGGRERERGGERERERERESCPIAPHLPHVLRVSDYKTIIGYHNLQILKFWYALSHL